MGKDGELHRREIYVTFTLLPEAPPKAPRSRSLPTQMVAAIAAAVVVVAGGAAYLMTRGSGSPVRPSAAVVPGAHAAPVPKTAKEWRAAAMSAARSAGWMHMESVAVVHMHGKTRTVRFSDDDGMENGIQRIAIDGTMHGEVRVVGSSTYFVANRSALAGYFGFPAPAAAQLANRWLVLHPGDQGYERVTAGVKLGSALSEMAVRGRLTLLPQRMEHGVRVVGVRGFVAGSNGKLDRHAKATLWVAVAGSHLPVAYEEHSGRTDSFVATFTHWRAPVSVVAPSVAAPLTLG